ncbi:Murein DD-endopeptidase MepM and murein hydrolase activator NlpD, contain LysM domain [Lishizhenia tianjinensis]|uniref:Murein DD-endopeptidase MepM and murein hydrolase activator NlpD, contain LysM domain n=1 Tax=Lishizhenia tianjinensis TaxID=477690 RepID=A0A1I7AWW1_9FLAO|nr:M23 family metallopeptidase [Lishizhenia tianjinensis]SFT79384.1 Murein DD-endopeptidase MepM and murein hydrolase activator NlpD, contain LysM domain [Lishizhenia tianjinensis]
MKEKKSFWKKLTRTTKIAGYNTETFQEKWGFKLNRIQMFSLMILFTIIIAGILISLLIFTPLGYLMPEGYSNPNKVKYEKALEETKRLEHEIETQDMYLENLRKVILGEISVDSVYYSKPEEINLENVVLDTTRSQNELKLAAEINKSIEEGNVNQTTTIDVGDLLFMDPVKGVISQGFNGGNHPGVDISVPEGSNVKACLDGIVISSLYSEEDGYSIIIAHDNGYTTIYKHNQENLKHAGDKIKKGDLIALAGNTGEHTTGPHLHFEIWQNSEPLNPLGLMSFK